MQIRQPDMNSQVMQEVQRLAAEFAARQRREEEFRITEQKFRDGTLDSMEADLPPEDKYLRSTT